jgi:hypothetical protein
MQKMGLLGDFRAEFGKRGLFREGFWLNCVDIMEGLGRKGGRRRERSRSGSKKNLPRWKCGAGGTILDAQIVHFV